MIQRIINWINKNNTKSQFLRFCVNGGVCAGIHYATYAFLQIWINVNIAFSIGYLFGFLFNYFSTTYFTFQTHPSWKRFFGFTCSHIVNYLVNMAFFNILLYLNIHRLIAPLLAMTIAMLINFVILKFVFRKK